MILIPGSFRPLVVRFSGTTTSTSVENVGSLFFPLTGRLGLRVESDAVNNPTTYNAAFPVIRGAIENTNNSLLQRIGYAVYLLYVTRKQVAHQVDISMELITQPDSTRFTTDVLLSLCRLRDWAI